jgi:predicted anti-sigma-YlaC factor YlaD
MECYEAIDLMGDALEDRLAPDARQGLQGHLDECPVCRNYLDQIRVTRDALGHLPPPRAGHGRRDELIDRFRKEFDAGA